jgi:hypothetical protein
MFDKRFFFTPLFSTLFLDPGSEIRDPGSGMGKNQDPGSGIYIPDPQHWLNQLKNVFNKLFNEYYLASFCW